MTKRFRSLVSPTALLQLQKVRVRSGSSRMKKHTAMASRICGGAFQILQRQTSSWVISQPEASMTSSMMLPANSGIPFQHDKIYPNFIPRVSCTFFRFVCTVGRPERKSKGTERARDRECRDNDPSGWKRDQEYYG